MPVAVARPDVMDLFSAHLADEGDLRALVKRGPARPRRVARRRPSVRTARKGARAVVTSSRRVNSRVRTGERGLLLVLDESSAAKRAVTYVGRLLGRRRGFSVCIAYVLPELPSSLLEHGGAGDPDEERQLAASLHAEQTRWVAQQKEEARGVIDEATKSLRTAGMSSRALEVRFCGPVSHGAVADEILQLARAKRCRTVVVGRHVRSWLGHLFAEDLREELARRAEGIAIWGIG